MNRRTADECRRQFVKLVTGHDGMAPYRRFELWAEALYCATAKASSLAFGDIETAARHEKRFGEIESNVGRSGIEAFAEMTGCLTMSLELNDGADFLSGLAGDDQIRALNQHIGQFFTPFEVCSMMAQMTVDEDYVRRRITEVGYITVSEPASGAGGMLLAIAKRMRELGYRPEWQLWADATDLSPLCFHMTYIQLSLSGIAGRVRHGDTLRNEFFASTLTFPSMFFIGRHGLPGGRQSVVPQVALSSTGQQATLAFD